MNRRTIILIMLLAVLVLFCSCGEKTPAQPGHVETTTGTDIGLGDAWETEGDSTPSASLGEETTTPTSGTSVSPTEETTEPDDNVTPVPEVGKKPEAMTYEQYAALSGSEQEAYALTFSSMADFIKWYNDALEDYENNDVIDVTGPIDLEDYLNPSNP